MTWIYLVVAGILEVVWATALKMSQGFSQFGASVVTVVGSILVGVICFRDRLPAITWLFVALLVIGIIGIKVTSGK